VIQLTVNPRIITQGHHHLRDGCHSLPAMPSDF
jgi:hypothetical protein